MATVVDHYAKHLGPLYEWMVGDIEAALVRSAAELDAIGLPSSGNGVAVDLGAGSGLHSLPLAQRGYAVIAVDSNEQLLESLRARSGSLPITTINTDLLGYSKTPQLAANVILCMGDTLTHLQNVNDVETLIANVVGSLVKDGVFVTTFRDYVSASLTAERRFIPVRSDAQRILTCFLEYHQDIVTVHDLLHQWKDGHWIQRVSSYQKLRLAPAWVAEQLRGHGLNTRVSTSASGMVCVVARRM